MTKVLLLTSKILGYVFASSLILLSISAKGALPPFQGATEMPGQESAALYPKLRAGTGPTEPSICPGPNCQRGHSVKIRMRQPSTPLLRLAEGLDPNGKPTK